MCRLRDLCGGNARLCNAHRLQPKSLNSLKVGVVRQEQRWQHKQSRLASYLGDRTTHQIVQGTQDAGDNNAVKLVCTGSGTRTLPKDIVQIRLTASFMCGGNSDETRGISTNSRLHNKCRTKDMWDVAIPI